MQICFCTLTWHTACLCISMYGFPLQMTPTSSCAPNKTTDISWLQSVLSEPNSDNYVYLGYTSILNIMMVKLWKLSKLNLYLQYTQDNWTKVIFSGNSGRYRHKHLNNEEDAHNKHVDCYWSIRVGASHANDIAEFDKWHSAPCGLQ